jgi:hypothetical protein
MIFSAEPDPRIHIGSRNEGKLLHHIHGRPHFSPAGQYSKLPIQYRSDSQPITLITHSPCPSVSLG